MGVSDHAELGAPHAEPLSHECDDDCRACGTDRGQQDSPPDMDSARYAAILPYFFDPSGLARGWHEGCPNMTVTGQRRESHAMKHLHCLGICVPMWAIALVGCSGEWRTPAGSWDNIRTGPARRGSASAGAAVVSSGYRRPEPTAGPVRPYLERDVGQLVNLSRIAADSGISHNTAKA